MARKIAIGLLLGYAAWCVLLWFGQDVLVFPGDLSDRAPPQSDPGPGGQVHWLETPDGARVESWFYPGDGRSAASPGPAVIYFHGSGKLLDDWKTEQRPYTAWGVSVLCVEYRGYGRSSGDPSQRAITADNVRFHDWLIQRPEVDATRIFFHGRSLGGAVAAALVPQRRPIALILESTFTNLTDAAWRLGVPPFILRHPYQTDRVLAAYEGPVLIVHGRNDEMVRISEARELKRLAKQATLIETEGGHHAEPHEREALIAPLHAFLVEHSILPPQ